MKRIALIGAGGDAVSIPLVPTANKGPTKPSERRRRVSDIGKAYTKAFRGEYKQFATWTSGTWIDVGTYGTLDSDGTFHGSGRIEVEEDQRTVGPKTFQYGITVTREPNVGAHALKVVPGMGPLGRVEVSIKANKKCGYLLQFGSAEVSKIKNGEIEKALKIIRQMILEESWFTDMVLVSERYEVINGILRVMLETDAGFSVSGSGSISPHGVLDLASIDASLPLTKTESQGHSADFTAQGPGTPIYSDLYKIKEKWIPKITPWKKPELRNFRLITPAGKKLPLDKPYPYGLIRTSTSTVSNVAFTYDPSYSELTPEQIESMSVWDLFERVNPSDDITEPSESRVILLPPETTPVS
jgi:hypothetical protein